MKTPLLASVFVLALAGSAQAGGQEDSVGLGAEFMINGLTGGASLNYDLGDFHVGGFIGFYDAPGDDNTDYSIGARFFYHLHSTAMSDFGIGGGLGFFSIDDRGAGDDRRTLLFLEPSFQIRAFVAANVALSFSAGIVLGLVDADGVALTGGSFEFLGDEGLGGVTGSAGIHYYFF